MPDAIHNKLLDLFKKYLLVGGLPDAVNEFLATKNIANIRAIQNEIHHLYGVDAARYEESHNRLKIQRIYGMVPSNLENKKKRVVDYLIDDMEHLSVLPLEVKSGKDYQVHSALDKFLQIKEYNIQQAFVLSNAQKVEIKDGVTYLPIYYITEVSQVNKYQLACL